MEPFSIVCKSCAAKLKVTKLSAVGQVLACPKCGSMVRVTPPDGWVAPKPERSASHSQISATDIDPSADDPLADLGGNFENLDDILKPATAPAIPSPKPRPKKSSAPRKSSNQKRTSSTKRRPKNAQAIETVRPAQKPPVVTSEISRPKVRQRQTNPIPDDEEPVLPTDEWTSETAQKRRRIVTTVVAILGTLTLLLAVAAAVVLNLPKKDSPAPIAENQDDDPQAEQVDEPEINPNFVINKPAKKGLLDQQDLAAQRPFENQPPAIGNAPPIGPPGVANNRPRRPANRFNTPPPLEPDKNHSKLQELSAPAIGDENANGPDANQDPAVPPKLLPQTPFAKMPNQDSTRPNETPFDIEPRVQQKPTEVGLVGSFELNLGELSSLLEQSGTSIHDLQDLAASIRTQPVVGLPKYIVALPESNKLDIAKQFDLPIGGLKFTNARLTQVVKHVSAVGGIPITIDARSLVAAGKDPNPLVTTTISDTTLNGAISALAQTLNLSMNATESGVILSSFPDRDPTNFSFAIPNGFTSDDAKLGLLDTIKMIVEPEAWLRKSDPDTIGLVGEQLNGTCPPAMQRNIEDLLEKMTASFTLSETPSDLPAITRTTTRWKSAESSLSKSPKLIHSISHEINEFLSQIESKTGVTLLVNWHEASKEDWTSQTVIPGNIREPSVEEAVASVARAMKLTFRAVDHQTIVITTFADAAKTVDIEVYPTSELIPHKMSAENLRQLVIETLGPQLQSEKVRYFYQPDARCLVVSAPQQLQRQIEGLMDRLKSELQSDRNPLSNQQARSLTQD